MKRLSLDMNLPAITGTVPEFKHRWTPIALICLSVLFACASPSIANAQDDTLQCDFDLNGTCDIIDLELLGDSLGLLAPNAFDLDGSGTVDLSDRDFWLVIAGNEVIGTPYVGGDSDLDGDVDSVDLNALGIHWQMVGDTGWGEGDFNERAIE